MDETGRNLNFDLLIDHNVLKAPVISDMKILLYTKIVHFKVQFDYFKGKLVSLAD